MCALLKTTNPKHGAERRTKISSKGKVQAGIIDIVCYGREKGGETGGRLYQHP